MNKSKTSILWGLIIIAVGVIFLGNNINLWNVEIFFDGWWALFIIIPSLFGLFKGEFLSSILGLTIGALLMLAANKVIPWVNVGKIFIPVMIIIAGLSLVFKPRVKFKKIDKHNKVEVPEHVAVFATIEEKAKEDFKGASCVTVFGGINLDLTKVDFKEDTIIECVAVFGGIDIKVPEGINVEVAGVPIFGGASSKTEPQKNKPTLYINYVCIFGGVEIK